MRHNKDLMNEAYSLLDTLLRVRNEGLELGMELYEFNEEDKSDYGIQVCGTVCCVAGWHSIFHSGTTAGLGKKDAWDLCPSMYSEFITTSIDDAPNLSTLAFGEERQKKLTRYGYRRMTSEETLAQQIALMRWIIRRERALEEWEYSESLPKRDRRSRQLRLMGRAA